MLPLNQRAGEAPRKALRIVFICVACLLFLFVAYPTLAWLANEWWTNDYYSHGMLVPVVSIVLAWRLWPRSGDRPSWPGALLLAVSLLAYLVAFNDHVYFASAFALIGSLAGTVWFLLGVSALKRLAFPLIFLAFMVPLPITEGSTVPLALITGRLAAGSLQLLGANIAMNGNQVILPNSNLVVGAQCSGVRSIVALFALAALLIFLLRGPALGKAGLFAAVIPVAMLGNVLRVASLIVVAGSWGTAAGFDFYHRYSGIVFFLFALGALILLSRVLQCREIRSDI